MHRLPSEDRATAILQEARFCLEVGYFHGALDRALRLRNHPELGLSARHVAWIARVYLGRLHWPDALNMRDVIAKVAKLYGGQGAAELCCIMQPSHPDSTADGVRQVLRMADAQHGVLATWHPKAILWLAEHALSKLRDPHSATLLTNLALGWHSVYASLDDVHKLASLLAALNAPTYLWADWCSILVAHIKFSTARPSMLNQTLQDPRDAVRWASAEDAASEGVVESVLGVAPEDVWTMLWSVAPHLDAPKLGTVIKTGFKASDLPRIRDVLPVWS